MPTITALIMAAALLSACAPRFPEQIPNWRRRQFESSAPPARGASVNL